MIYYQKCANHTTYYTDCTACVLNTLNHIAEIQSSALDRSKIILLGLAQERDEMRERIADFESGKLIRDITAARDHWMTVAYQADEQLARARSALSELLECVLDPEQVGITLAIDDARAALENAKPTQLPE